MGRREEPLADGPLREFAQGLRDLRAAAGLPYRALERRAGFSASALSAAAGGDRLPSLEVTRAYAGACGGDMDAWEGRWRELAEELHSTHPGLLPAEPAPDEAHGVSAAPLGPLDPASIGPFTLEGRLGAGTMGQVYLGRTPGGRPVAVKVIHPALAGDTQFRRRFARELAAIRRVQGLFTAAVVDADPDAEQPWLATAYVPGPTLAQRLEAQGPLSGEQTAALAAGVAEALGAIHAAGLVHRDLKPSNVILAPDGVKVIDFGIAYTADATTLTITGSMLGSAPFMAPETAEDRGAVGPAADVFALGSLLVYAATGTPPFGEGTPAAVLYRIVHTEPDLSALTGTDNNLHNLIAQCLAKDPAARPTPAQILTSLGAGAPAAGWAPAPAADPDPDRVGTIARLRAPLRPRLSLAPLLLVLAIVAVAVILATRPGGTPRLNTQPPETPAPASAAPAGPPGPGDPGTGPTPGSSAPAGGQGPPEPTAAPSGGGGVPPPGGPTPSSGGIAPSPQGATWTHTDGPTCSGMTRDGTWTKINGTATAGCTDGYWHKQTGDRGNADWVFSPGKGKSCAFTISIANSTTITATRAEYQFFEDSASHGTPLASPAYLNQAANRGGTITLAAPTTPKGTYDLQLYDFTGDGTNEYAGVVTLTCT